MQERALQTRCGSQGERGNLEQSVRGFSGGREATSADRLWRRFTSGVKEACV